MIRTLMLCTTFFAISKNFSCTGEIDCEWKTRKKEHIDKVRLTKEDTDAGNLQRETERTLIMEMSTGDGGLAKHASTYSPEVNTKI